MPFPREFRAHAPPGKFLRLNFSEVQSSAFWMLNLANAWIPIEDVMLKYLINHKKGERGQGPSLNLPLSTGL